MCFSFPALDSLLLAFGMPGGMEWVVLLVIGLLIFGRRLPEVGRSLGRGIVEFKKGVKGIEDEIDEASGERPRADQRLETRETPRIEETSVQPESAPVEKNPYAAGG